jgi:hypothetical protein
MAGPFVALFAAKAADSPARAAATNNPAKRKSEGGNEIEAMGFKSEALSIRSFPGIGKNWLHAVRTSNTGRLPRIKLLEGLTCSST